MPNQHGGKAYKKGKKPAPPDGAKTKFAGREEGQDYGRITRMLGNRRVLCFCNDGVERVGKIRGALCRGPKRQKIEVGDIVIISTRSFDDVSDSDDDHDTTTIQHVDTGGRKEVVDILEKISSSDWRQIRKETGIHKDLFPNTSSADGLDDLFEKAEDADDAKSVGSINSDDIENI
jgi:translation initiation factor 1A